MESIIGSLGHSEFARLRIGIGRPESKEDVGHVLGNFGADEQAIIEETLEQGVGALELWLREGIEKAMNQFNA